MSEYKPRHASVKKEKSGKTPERRNSRASKKVDQSKDAFSVNKKKTDNKITDTGKKNLPDPATLDRFRQRFALFFPVLIILLCILVVFVKAKDISYDPATENTPEEIPVVETDTRQLKQVWSENRALNEDYVGQIVFDSGLIDLPFVQARSVYKENGEMYRFFTEDGQLITDPEGYNGNDVYIWTNWKTGEYDRTDEGGSVFLDYRNELDDQNLLVYGHHFARDWDPSGSKQFSPLDNLLKEEYYEENKTLKLVLEDQIRYYVISHVYVMDTQDRDQTQIARTNMDTDLYNRSDPGYFTKYIGIMDRISKYDTGVKLKEGDRILTLVTCIQHEPRYRQIIVCKEIKVEFFEQ